jgi:flagellar hook-associated protein 3 FlgL
MRIADNTITRNYLNNLSGNTEQLYAASTKVSSGKSYQEASEDPSDAIKAMKVRSTLSKISTYQSNIDEAKGILSEREAVLSELTNIVTEAKSQILQGQSGTYSETDRSTISDTFESYQKTVLSLSNQMYSDKYIFGGSKDYQTPFTLDSGGKLLYQGQDVDSGSFGTEEVNCDIGLGGQGSSGYNISSPGSSLLGTGTDTNGITNNLYNLFGDIAEQFSNNDMSNISTYTAKLTTIGDNILAKYAGIGEESSYIKMFSDRLTNTQTNATGRLSSLENADTAQASVEYSQQETAYQATLQVGAKLITKTLLDYLS